MARKKAGGGATKSELIRRAKQANPSAGPTEIAAQILAEHNQKVSPAMVSTVLSQDRTRGGKPSKRGRPPKSTKPGRKSGSKAVRGDLSIETLLRIKKLAEDLGGVAEAKKALDALSQILA